MASKFLKKIIAKDQQGLNTISAICSESKIKISDIKFLKNNQIFLLLIQRFNKEGSKKEKKINSILKFEYINASKSKNINQNNNDKIRETLNESDKKKIKKLILNKSIKDIVGIISEEKNISKSKIYNYCLQIKNET